MEYNVNWEELYKLWREYEGLELKAYPDPATGNEPWTIGYGHTGLMSGTKVKRGDVITKEQAEQFMINDLHVALEQLKLLIKVELNANQWAAILSFKGNLKHTTFLKSSVLKYINAGRLSEVPGRMALYRLGDGKVMTGLVRRRAAEGNLWMKPVGTTAEAKKDIKGEVKEAQGVKVEPANPKKPWDWGAAGGVITLLASMSDQIKKLIGNVTATFGVDPLILILVVGVGFAAFTIYNKWKDR